MGGDSCSEGPGFESLQDGQFSHLIVVKINEKRPGMAQEKIGNTLFNQVTIRFMASLGSLC